MVRLSILQCYKNTIVSFKLLVRKVRIRDSWEKFYIRFSKPKCSESPNVFPFGKWGGGGGKGSKRGRASGIGGVLDVTNLLLRVERCVCVLVRKDNPFPTL
jgi:hypothetical protein